MDGLMYMRMMMIVWNIGCMVGGIAWNGRVALDIGV